MKVLHIFKTYYPDSFGGVEQVIFQLAEDGIGQGVEAEVFSLTKNGSKREVKVGNHTAHRSALSLYIASTGFSFSAFKDFKKLTEKADIIHYHFPWPFMDMLHFIGKPNKPTVLTYHSDIVKQKYLLKIYTPLMYKFLKKIDRIVATSPNYLKTSPVLQKFKNKTLVIPIGITNSNRKKSKNTRIDYWKNKIDGRFFLYIGALRYYKGLDFLIESLEKTELQVVIIGGGPIEEKLKKKADLLQIKNIHFLGSLIDEDKFALLELCYGIVFPSHLRSEAFGITLVEGAMYGKPLISCEIGTGTTFINIHNETGLCIPPGDPLELRRAMEVLWNDNMLAKKYGEAARKRYLELFTANQMSKKYLDLYNDLLTIKS